ncbi:MAG: aminotransferase class I/II-fold pyridoxal phosphate-dependent enzyme [Limnochordia bacterium]
MEDTPILQGIRNYIDAQLTAFHTPGHKQGKGAYAPLVDLLGEKIFPADVGDELIGDAGEDLHQLIEMAERKTAEIYGMDRSFFLVNGATSGIQAMLLSLGSGRQILVDRNIHISVSMGLVLADLRPIYVPRRWSEELGIPLDWDRDHYGHLWQEHPQTAAALVVYPTYHGYCGPLADLIADKVGQVLVDEAHGPHFPFHPQLPPSACALGANYVVHSAHKLLGALTQGAYLHIKDVPAHVQACVDGLSTTSPSPLLLASLDGARAQLASQGGQLWGRILALAREAQERIDAIPGLYCLGPHFYRQGLISDYDPVKLHICLQPLGITGWEAAGYLNERGIRVEMADWWTALFILTYADGREEVEALISALEELAQEGPSPRGRSLRGKNLAPPPIPPQGLTPREAFFSPKELVPLERARGRIAGEAIAPYPPGIPLILPGEEYTEEIIAYLHLLRSYRVKVRGATDPNLLMVSVI